MATSDSSVSAKASDGIAPKAANTNMRGDPAVDRLFQTMQEKTNPFAHLDPLPKRKFANLSSTSDTASDLAPGINTPRTGDGSQCKPQARTPALSDYTGDFEMFEPLAREPKHKLDPRAAVFVPVPLISPPVVSSDNWLLTSPPTPPADTGLEDLVGQYPYPNENLQQFLSRLSTRGIVSGPPPNPYGPMQFLATPFTKELSATEMSLDLAALQAGRGSGAWQPGERGRDGSASNGWTDEKIPAVPRIWVDEQRDAELEARRAERAAERRREREEAADHGESTWQTFN